MTHDANSRSHQVIHNDCKDFKSFHETAPAPEYHLLLSNHCWDRPQISMHFSMSTCEKYRGAIHWRKVRCEYLFVNGDKSTVHSLCTESSTNVQCLSSKLEARLTSIVCSSHTPVVAIASCWLDMYCIMRSSTCTYQHWTESWYHQESSHSTRHHWCSSADTFCILSFSVILTCLMRRVLIGRRDFELYLAQDTWIFPLLFQPISLSLQIKQAACEEV